MSTILYNTNSSFIQRYQRNNTLRHNKKLSTNSDGTTSITKTTNGVEDDDPFHSKWPKDSPEYLQELCCAYLPSPLHQRIRNLKISPDLEVISIVALIYKNFISNWYGVKIPTKDSQFATELFNIIERLISYLRKSNIDIKTITLDEFPALLSTHIRALRMIDKDVSSPDKIYKEYCQFTLYEEDTYPYVITNLIQISLRNSSLLQGTFIDAILNQLLLGRVFDSISEPYYVLRGISKISNKIIGRRASKITVQHESIWASMKLKLSKFIKIITYISSYDKKNNKEARNSLFDRYIFHSWLVDLFQLQSKKPLLYSLLKTFQKLASRSMLITSISNNIIDHLIENKVMNSSAATSLARLIRHTLFPNDNNMGPRTLIPTGVDFEKFKSARVEELWDACQLYKTSLLLNITKSDVRDFIDAICINKECNKLLLFRMIDCLLANITD